MYYKLYIDSVFFIQFVMNLYLLSITGKVLKCTATHLRLVLGALIGAISVCLIIMLPFSGLRIRLITGAAGAGVLMLYIVFKLRTPGLLIKSSAVMALCGFFFGSIIFWLQRRFPWGGLSIWTLAFLGFGGYLISLFLTRRFGKVNRSDLKKVRIPVKGREIRMTALLDTGNHLSEPVSGAPVCIISAEAADGVSPCFEPEKYHAVPYHSVGKKAGIMDAYELPELVIEEDYGEIRRERVLVAICNNGISKDSAYQMILHPGLLD